MSIQVETKDCTQLSDAELGEMADLCAEGPIAHEIGTLGKEAAEWVLVTQAREGNKLRGFTFSTLERIGGTPCVLIGMGHIGRSSRRDTVLNGIMADELRRAVLAFPDEDVVVATRMADAAAFEAFKTLHDIVPRTGHKASGEERAWGRRLAKRFGISAARYEDRKFKANGSGSAPMVLDHESLKPERVSEFAEFFEGVDPANGDCVIGFGWAMAEDLEKFGD